MPSIIDSFVNLFRSQKAAEQRDATATNAQVAGNFHAQRDNDKLVGYGAPPPGTYDTYRKIIKYPTVALARYGLIGPILGSSWTVEADDGVAQDRIDFVDRHFVHDHRHQLIRDCVRGVDFGWSPFEPIFAQAKVLGVDRIVYDRIKYLIPDLTTVLLTNPEGLFWGLRNKALGKQIDLESEKTFIYTFDREGDNYYGNPLAENIRETFGKLRDDDDRVGRFNEKVSGVVPVLMYPRGTTRIGNDDVENHVIAKKVVDSLGACRGVIFPNEVAAIAQQTGGDIRQAIEKSAQSKWSLTFLDAGNASGATVFSDRMTRYDKLLVRGYLQPERLLLEATTAGSRADSESASGVGLGASELIHNDITRAINKGLVDPLLAYNFGLDAVGTIRLKATPMYDSTIAQYQELVKLLLNNPVVAPELPAMLDLKQIIEGAGLPLDESAESQRDNFEMFDPREGDFTKPFSIKDAA